MRKSRLLPAIVLVTCATFLQVHAQQITDEASGQAVHRFSEEYLRVAGDHAALFGGRVPALMPENVESRYLRDRDPASQTTIPSAVNPIASYAGGDLFYDGIFYTGVRMRLDLYRNELVAAPPSSSLLGSVLEPSRLGYADLRGYRIVHSSSLSTGLQDGYYLQLHAGRHTVLKKETFFFNHTSMQFTGYSIRYYIEKDGAWHQLGRRKSQLLRLFGDRRGELDRFIRTNRINLRHDTESALMLVVSEYERLTTTPTP